jgi:hypothetical protein
VEELMDEDPKLFFGLQVITKPDDFLGLVRGVAIAQRPTPKHLLIDSYQAPHVAKKTNAHGYSALVLR